MKILHTLLFIFFFYSGFSQAGCINGERFTGYGTTVTYSVPNLHIEDPYSVVTWNVSGGTKIGECRRSCEIQWDPTQSQGYISVYVDYPYEEWCDLQIKMGDIIVVPVNNIVDYGSLLTLVNDNPYPAEGTYEWFFAPTSSGPWGPASGVNTLATYTISSVTAPGYYKCFLYIDNQQLNSNYAYVGIKPFQAGTITLNQQPSFSNILSIGNTTASGGYCSSTSYQYEWEMYTQGNEWTTISIQRDFPTNITITGETTVRRKVTCGGVSLYSNTLSITPTYTAQDFENLNYVRTIDLLVPGQKSWQQADALPMNVKLQSTSYLDGFGRTIQSVDKQVSYNGSLWSDKVQHYEFDVTGTPEKSFLPYVTVTNTGRFKTDAAGAQQAYIHTKYNEASTAPTYYKTEHDNSPLKKMVKAFSPGQSWGGSNIGLSTQNDFNDVQEKVHTWTLAYSLNALPITQTTQVYGTGMLSRQEIIDHSGSKVVNYTDFDGNKILTKIQDKDQASVGIDHAGWACTYYVYDDLGNLKFVIPPKVVEYMDINGWNLTQQMVEDLCFRYSYDEKARPVIKKTPGVGEIHMVYDSRDRLVFIQDARQRLTNQWVANLYDNLDRQISTGLIDYPTPAGYTNAKDALQASINSITNNGSNQLTTLNGTAPPVSLFPSTRLNVPAHLLSSSYIASQEIIFLPGFESEPAADFVAEISSASVGSNNGFVNANPIPNGISYYMLSQTYYDNYNYPGVRAFNQQYTFASSSSTTIQPVQKTDRIVGAATGSINRILGSNNFLVNTIYYDEYTRISQTLTDNIKSGVDIQTYQYDYAGNLINSCIKHMAGTSKEFSIVAKNELDKFGRILKLSNNYNNTFFKQLAEYTYDDLGQLKTKRLAPGYSGSGKSEMETLNYEYNVHGWLTGINKHYALSTTASDQWNNFFGLYLGYDNKDGHFSNAQLDGKLTGTIWRSQGDNAVRRYDYTYDRLNRFRTAVFKQKSKPGDSWSSSTVDLSVFTQYEDANGNIKELKQFGIVPGATGGVVIDDLQYNYDFVAGTTGLTNNLLKKIQDQAVGSSGIGSRNGSFKDFSDGINAPVNDDYTYDVNGNLTIDLNKNIKDGLNDGVVYNFQNKPEKITINGKAIIEYTYDATGSKLSKKVTDLSVTPNTVKTTFFLADFIYLDNDLESIITEVGRIRMITPINSSQMVVNAGSVGILNQNGKEGVFDYFIKDNLGNVRMVLTEEVRQDRFLATMEKGSVSNPNIELEEEREFGQIDANGNPSSQNELKLTRIDKPLFWNKTNSSDPFPLYAGVVKLTAANGTTRTGPNMLFKVMAGDRINARSDYFYINNNDVGPQPLPVQDLVGALMAAFAGNKASEILKASSNALASDLAGSSALNAFLNGRYNSGQTPNSPKAYLNIVFYDEQFRFVEQDPSNSTIGSNAKRVSQANTQDANLVLQQQAPKNGWAYVYLSNESNESVYFDNLAISQDHGRITEDNHYYPHGLKIAGITSKAYATKHNRYAYQANLSEEDELTGWNEFDLRNYDPQRGTWTAADPYDEFSSPYIGMGNDPVNNIDPSGGFITESKGEMLAALGGAVVGVFAAHKYADNNRDKLSKSDLKWVYLGGFFAGGLAGWGATQLSFDFLKSETLNFFVVSDIDKKMNIFNSASNALFMDYTWAKIQSFFSFGNLRVINEASFFETAKKISEILNKKNKTIGSLIPNSHGARETGYLNFGNTEMSASDDLASDEVANQELVRGFEILRNHVTNKTKIMLGTCWGGYSRNLGSDMVDQLSEILKGATVYGNASVSSTRALWFRRTYSSLNITNLSKDDNPWSRSFDSYANIGKWTKYQNGVKVNFGGYILLGHGGRIIESKKPFINSIRKYNIQKRLFVRAYQTAVLNWYLSGTPPLYPVPTFRRGNLNLPIPRTD